MKKVRSKLTRIGLDFDEEMKDIQDMRLDMGIDKNRCSKSKLTNLIIKHKLWNTIKQEAVMFSFAKRSRGDD